MGDDGREFKIRITGDAEGLVSEGRRAGDELEKTHEKGGQAAEKHAGHIRGLHKVFHSLNEIVPGLGVAMQAAFSPIGAAVSLAVLAMRMFHEKMKEVNEEFKKMEEEAAKPTTNRLEALREGTVKAAEGMSALQEKLAAAARSEVNLKEATAEASAAIREQTRDTDELADAHKANELAGVQDVEQRMQIEQKYREMKRQGAEREEMAEILVRQRELEEAQGNQGGLNAAAVSAESARISAMVNLNAFTGSKGGIEERRKSTAAALKAFEEKNPIFDGLKPGMTQPEVERVMQANAARGGMYSTQGSDVLYPQWEKLKAAADLAEKNWSQMPGEEARLTVAAASAQMGSVDAARAAAGNQGFITETQRDLAMRRGRFAARKSTDAELTGIERDTLSKEHDAPHLQALAAISQLLQKATGNSADLVHIAQQHYAALDKQGQEIARLKGMMKNVQIP